MNIFVAKISFQTTEEDLNEAFSEYGTVTTARVIIDKRSGCSKGYGFVEMEDDDAAQKAIAEMDGSELQGRTIVVKVANPPKEYDN